MLSDLTVRITVDTKDAHAALDALLEKTQRLKAEMAAVGVSVGLEEEGDVSSSSCS